MDRPICSTKPGACHPTSGPLAPGCTGNPPSLEIIETFSCVGNMVTNDILEIHYFNIRTKNHCELLSFLYETGYLSVYLHLSETVFIDFLICYLTMQLIEIVIPSLSVVPILHNIITLPSLSCTNLLVFFILFLAFLLSSPVVQDCILHYPSLSPFLSCTFPNNPLLLVILYYPLIYPPAHRCALLQQALAVFISGSQLYSNCTTAFVCVWSQRPCSPQHEHLLHPSPCTDLPVILLLEYGVKTCHTCPLQES